MKLSKIKEILPSLENVEFQLENGTFVPEHFHVTEVGQITKKIYRLWRGNSFRKSSEFSVMGCR